MMEHPALVCLYLKTCEHIDGAYLAYLAEALLSADLAKQSDDDLWQHLMACAHNPAQIESALRDQDFTFHAKRILGEKIDDPSFLAEQLAQKRDFILRLLRALLEVSQKAVTFDFVKQEQLSDLIHFLKDLDEQTIVAAYGRETFISLEASQPIAVALLRLMARRDSEFTRRFARYCWLLNIIKPLFCERIDNSILTGADGMVLAKYDTAAMLVYAFQDQAIESIDEESFLKAAAAMLGYIDERKRKWSSRLALSFLLNTFASSSYYDVQQKAQVQLPIRIKQFSVQAVLSYYRPFTRSEIETAIIGLCSPTTLTLAEIMEVSSWLLRQLKVLPGEDTTTILRISNLMDDYRRNTMGSDLRAARLIREVAPKYLHILIATIACAKRHALLLPVVHDETKRTLFNTNTIAVILANVPSEPTQRQAYEQTIQRLLNASMTEQCFEMTESQFGAVVKSYPAVIADDLNLLLRQYVATGLLQSKKPRSLNQDVFHWTCILEEFPKKQELFLLLCRNPRALAAMLASKTLQQAEPSTLSRLYVSFPTTIRNAILAGCDSKAAAQTTRQYAKRLLNSTKQDHMSIIFKVLIEQQFKTASALIKELHRLASTDKNIHYPFPSQFHMPALAIPQAEYYLQAFILCIEEALIREGKCRDDATLRALERVLMALMDLSEDLVCECFITILKQSTLRVLFLKSSLIRSKLSVAWLKRVDLVDTYANQLPNIIGDLFSDPIVTPGVYKSCLSLLPAIYENRLCALLDESPLLHEFIKERIYDLPESVMVTLYLAFEDFRALISDSIPDAQRMVKGTTDAPDRQVALLRMAESEEDNVLKTFLFDNALLRPVIVHLSPDEAYTLVFETVPALGAQIFKVPCPRILTHLLGGSEEKQLRLLQMRDFLNIMASEEWRVSEAQRAVLYHYDFMQVLQQGDAFQHAVLKVLSLLLDNQGHFNARGTPEDYFVAEKADKRSAFLKYRAAFLLQISASSPTFFSPADSSNPVRQESQTHGELDTTYGMS